MPRNIPTKDMFSTQIESMDKSTLDITQPLRTEDPFLIGKMHYTKTMSQIQTHSTILSARKPVILVGNDGSWRTSHA